MIISVVLGRLQGQTAQRRALLPDDSPSRRSPVSQRYVAGRDMTDSGPSRAPEQKIPDREYFRHRSRIKVLDLPIGKFF